MKPSTLFILFLSLFLIPHGMSKNIDFKIDKATLPQVMEALKRVSTDPEFAQMTYSLPRIYHDQGAELSIGDYRNFSEEQLRAVVIQDLCRAHRLLFDKKENNHHRFFRDPAFQTSDPFTMPEALATLLKHIKKSSIDLRNWEIVRAEVKLESTPTNFGRYWHFQYKRDPGTDGGVGTHHFFVWNDLLVEHRLDGDSQPIQTISTEEIIKTMRTPAP